MIGINLGGGVGWGELTGFESYDPNDPNAGFDDTGFMLGYGGGGQAFFTYQFTSLVGLGANFGYGYWVHEDDDNEVTYTGSIPSIGPLLRLQSPNVVANLWANYFFGSLDIEPEGAESFELDLGGFELGAVIAYPIRLNAVAAIEVGPMITVRTGTASVSADFGFVEFTTSAADILKIDTGLIAQGTFEIGL